MNIQERILLLKKYIEANDFKGWDPYDALNSPILRLLSFNLKFGRIFWTQFMRCSAINFRPLLLTPKGYNPKAIGFCISSYAKLCHLWKKEEDSATLSLLIQKLKELKSLGYSGGCWGYNFNWQSRAAFLKAYTPTIVNTAFIGHALLDCHELLGNQEALDLANSCVPFFLKDLNRKKEGDVFCFSYTPEDENYVHNANMMGASFLARLDKITGQGNLISAAIPALEYSLKYQHDDGSWYYAETQFQKWIDSFHTGFNLIALSYFLKYCGSDRIKASYEKAIDYYSKNFFLEDGTPKYYHNKIYPIDIHAPAVAISVLSSESRFMNQAEKVYSWLIDNMADSKSGHFYFRKLKNCTIKIPYIRWSQAWALYGLIDFYANSNGLSPKSEN